MKEERKFKDKGETILFTGSRLGRSYAALGVALRVVAHSGLVVFIHFSGPQYPDLGEVKAATIIGSNLRMVGIKSEASDLSYLKDFHESVETVADASDMARNVWVKQCNLLVLSDILLQIDRGIIDVAEVLALIEDRPPHVNVILTGTSAPNEITKVADLISECLQIKEPSSFNVEECKGIGF